jgi:hypothetical protein
MLFLLSFDLVIRLSIGCWAKEEKEVQFPAAIEMCIAAVANRIGDLIVDPSDPAFLRHSPPLHTFFFQPVVRCSRPFVLHRLWPWGFVSVSFFFFFLSPLTPSYYYAIQHSPATVCVCVLCGIFRLLRHRLIRLRATSGVFAAIFEPGK